MDPIDLYRNLIDSLIGYQEWSETNSIDREMSEYSIESKRSDYTAKELEILSEHLNIDLNSKDSYFPLQNGVCLFYDLGNLILFVEK